MTGVVRGWILGLALCFPLSALASAPTPEGVAYMQKLFGFDTLIDEVFQKQFDGREPFTSLAPEQMTCLGNALRGEMHTALGKSMSEMFADQQTVADWMRFSLTTGGGKFLKFVRETVIAAGTGETPPDLAAAMTALPTAEQLEVMVFMQSPAAQVMQKKFPEMTTPGEAAIERQFERCGIVPRKPDAVTSS